MYKSGIRIFLLMGLFVFGSCWSVFAHPSIVGSWGAGHADVGDDAFTSITFYSNGYYIHIDAGTDAPQTDGAEYGTYSWDSATGQLTLTIIKDENGDHGIVDWDQITTGPVVIDASFIVIGDQLIITPNDGTLVEVYNRVQSSTEAIVGSWGDGYYPNGVESADTARYVSITFYPNGYYVQYEDGNTNQLVSGNGVECGTYSYNQSTGQLTGNILIDENSDHGFSEWDINATTLPYDTSEDTLTVIEDNDVIIALNRVGGHSHSYYLPYFRGHSNHWTAIGVKNLNRLADADITVTVYNQSGTVIDTENRNLPAFGNDNFVVAKGEADEGWIKIESDQPLRGLCFFATTGTPDYMADITFMDQVYTVLHVPHVGQGPVYDTKLYVCNPNDTTTVVEVRFISKAGNVLYTTTKEIPGNGSWQYALSNLVPDSTQANYGSLEIIGTQRIGAFALYNNLKDSGTSYAGISAEPE